MNPNSPHQKFFWAILIVVAVLLSIATTYAQVDDISYRFIKVQQEKVHDQMVDGVAGNPWQYRIFADWMIEQVIQLTYKIGIVVPKASVFIAFRFIQCLLIFLAAGIYYRKLGLPLFTNLIGLSLLSWGMSTSLYNSDLAFNNFFDIAFYLLAAITIMDRKFFWIPILIILAAFNRETSALIPFMLIGHAYFDGRDDKPLKPAAIYTVISLIIFTAIFFGLRAYYGEQQFLTADGFYPGLGLLKLNLIRVVTWEQLLLTLGIIPFLAVLVYRAWPKTLKIYFWVVVPAWITIHFLASLVAESRLLLVPQALVFIPGALFGIIGMARQQEKSQ